LSTKTQPDSSETQFPAIPESGDAHKVEINLGCR
jgi:hypothetical protein